MMPIDILAAAGVGTAIDRGASAEDIARDWPASHGPFLAARERVLLYR
jgi:hypothetical protein